MINILLITAWKGGPWMWRVRSGSYLRNNSCVCKTSIVPFFSEYQWLRLRSRIQICYKLISQDCSIRKNNTLSIVENLFRAAVQWEWKFIEKNFCLRMADLYYRLNKIFVFVNWSKHFIWLNHHLTPCGGFETT